MNKRKKAIGSVEFASNLLGLRELLVDFRPENFFLNPDINAVFDDKNYIICFNETWLCKASADEIMVTAFHETRHAYQKANIDFPEFFVERESIETVRQWKIDFDNYKPAHDLKNLEGKLEYLTQSIELDAIAYTHYQMNKLFYMDTVVPNMITDIVNELMKNHSKR